MEQKHIVGTCAYCLNNIYEDEKYEIMIYDQPLMFSTEYTKGIIHNRCRLPASKRLVKILLRDIQGLTWLLEGLINIEKRKRE